MDNLTERLIKAIQNSPESIIALETLESLRLCDDHTLKTTLSRLSKSGKIIRLKRGVYSANPIRDAFIAAQYAYSGYLGFSSALYMHRLITELPFAITVVTVYKSASKMIGAYEFRAVALKEKAIGFENLGNSTVSTRAKTLFDCIYLEKYSIERDKLIEAYKTARLGAEELKEFDSYVRRFVKSSRRDKFDKIRKEITSKS
jgi:predicted transcriptional regulator of viral defense system